MLFSDAFLWITLHYWTYMEDTRNKITLSCIESYFTLSGGSRYCYRRMIRIVFCWKVISCCVIRMFLQNIRTLSNKQHYITSYHTWYRMAAKLHQHQNIKHRNQWTHIMAIHVFFRLSKCGLHTHKYCKENWTS